MQMLYKVNMPKKPIRLMLQLFSLIALLMLFGCGGTVPVDDHTVAAVNLERYQGKWYEIASFPTSFQKGCFCVTAEYILKKDYVRVINRCRRGSAQGEWDEARGKAWPVEGSKNSRLEVSFFWPFKGDYWVIALDEEYQWVLVGHPERDYLWILAREPQISEALYDSLRQRAQGLGYQISRLKRMDQSCGQ